MSSGVEGGSFVNDKWNELIFYAITVGIRLVLNEIYHTKPYQIPYNLKDPIPQAPGDIFMQDMLAARKVYNL